MADKHVNSISLKALVDKVNNRVIFAESDDDFIDVLFSFLTIPMGTIIKLTRNQPPAENVGCMNNLYKSVENFDVQRLQTEACKTMLLCPRSAAETHCRSLKLKFDDGEPTRYFLCSSRDCSVSKSKLLSHHMGALCSCGETMSREINLSNRVSQKSNSTIQDRGVFVKGLTRLLISDDLKVTPSSPKTSVSLLTENGIVDGSNTEERIFDIGVDKVLNLLKCSLVSKTPLTETLLKNKPNLQNQPQMEPAEPSKGDGKICIKILVNKSKKVVYYAEAREDFVDLLFSFLTVPLGYILKEMRCRSSKGCVDYLHTSAQNLVPIEYMKSDELKAMLVNPKVAPDYRYENQPLGIVDASHPPYYLGQCIFLNGGCIEERLTTEETPTPSGNSGTVLTVMDPKSHYIGAKKGRGFVEGPAMFTITDDLVITPISPVSGISLLNKLKVPFNEVEEQEVCVGSVEALRLLVGSFVSENALTNAFIQKDPS